MTEEGCSLTWAGLNKGKLSIAVDIHSAEGRELVAELIAAPRKDAEIFLSNFPPRGRRDYKELQRRRQDLIYISVLGDRHGGSAVDYTVNPRVGFPWRLGLADRNT